MDNRPIGIFDSGVGGLTVVREIMKALPMSGSCIWAILPGSHMAQSPTRP